MRSKKIYKKISMGELKEEIESFADDCTVEYFEVQVSRNGCTSHRQSIRLEK